MYGDGCLAAITPLIADGSYGVLQLQLLDDQNLDSIRIIKEQPQPLSSLRYLLCGFVTYFRHLDTSDDIRSGSSLLSS